MILLASYHLYMDPVRSYGTVSINIFILSELSLYKKHFIACDILICVAFTIGVVVVVVP